MKEVEKFGEKLKNKVSEVSRHCKKEKGDSYYKCFLDRIKEELSKEIEDLKKQWRL